MANKKNNVVKDVKEQPNPPQNLSESTFFNRLSFRLSEEQRAFRDAIYDKNKDIIFVNARSGTGKTTVAVATACAMIEYGLYDKILYCFSMNNGFQNTMGLLPGTQEDKESAFYEPCLQALVECGYFPEKAVKELCASGNESEAFVSCRSHTFLRGTNIDEKTILIIDEAQNFYVDELRKVLTRVKNGTKVIVIGHDGQCDLLKGCNRSGFVPYIECFSKYEWAEICQLTESHRGRVCEVADDFDFEKWEAQKK